MTSPDWNSLAFDHGALVEIAGDGGRIAVWVRLDSERDRKFEYWDRVIARTRDERTAGGVSWVPATAVRTRRRSAGGQLGRILARLARRPSDACWIMPDGRAAERCGDRRAGLALAWADDGLGTLDEGRLEGIWRGDIRLLRLSGRLILVSGIEVAATEFDEVAEAEDPAATAARLLESARAAGDRFAEAAALADLGALWAMDGRHEAALGLLHEALALRRTLGDLGGEADVLVDLGRVLDTLGRPRESREALEAAFVLADGLEDIFARKAVLERLGDALARRGNPAGAAAALARARESARTAADRRHEARLLWLEAAAWAEAGRPDLALARAGESVALLRSAGAVEADWYEAQLQRYRPDASASTMAVGVSVGDPGIFRMAASATRAMAAFLGSGARTATPGERDRRLAACRACPHHTGLRCRICGCFTRAKAAMPHERCPIGRW